MKQNGKVIWNTIMRRYYNPAHGGWVICLHNANVYPDSGSPKLLRNEVMIPVTVEIKRRKVK